MKTIDKKITLMNGTKIPCIGFGTWQTPDGTVATKAVKTAIQLGYRHIDTAAIYGNEKSVGEGIHQSGIARENLFVTSKVWNANRGYDKTIAAFNQSLNDLKLDYLDLYLIHWPASANQFENWKAINLDTWRALERLYKEGRVKAIGVSNFNSIHLDALMKEAEFMPVINQIEVHPGYPQKELVNYCQNRNIKVEAWSPLGSGRVLQDPTLASLAKKYNKSVAQLCIRWCIQRHLIPLPKSVTPNRIESNRQVFDFTIDEDDMKTMTELPPLGFSGLDPEQIKF